MAENVSQTKRIPERAKLAVVPVLVAVLLYVLSDEQPSSTSPVAVANNVTASPMSAPGDFRTPASSGGIQRPRKVWPTMPLEDIVDNNPFDFPTELLPSTTSTVGVNTVSTERDRTEQTEATRRQELLDIWRSTEPSVIYRSSSGVVALIGEQVIREGDILDNVIQVVSVDANGIVFQLISE